MKRQVLLVLITLFIISTEMFAQMNISTYLRQDKIWNETTEEWDVISTDEEELTFFEFNKDFTMFKHTTPTITSAYLIKSNEENKNLEQYELSVVSDAGNKYMMILDFNKNNLRFIYEYEGSLIMVWHGIKKVWFDDDDEDK